MKEGCLLIEEYLKNGKITYCYNVSKKGNISKDMFKIDYEMNTIYLLCTFDGLKVIHTMLIS